MSRETVSQKALRYIAEGRLRVTRVEPDRIDAVCVGPNDLSGAERLRLLEQVRKMRRFTRSPKVLYLPHNEGLREPMVASGVNLLKGVDSLLSIVQMPAGVPVGTLAIGEAGAKNAGLLAVSILALKDAELRGALDRFREHQTSSVLAARLP